MWVELFGRPRTELLKDLFTFQDLKTILVCYYASPYSI